MKLFGIFSETSSETILFSCPEGSHPKSGKVNIIISTLFFFLLRIAPKVRSLAIHADNCTGENKNRYLLGFLQWTIQTRLFDKVSVHFMIVGHTRNHLDGSFGRLKSLYFRSNVYSLSLWNSLVSSLPNTHSIMCFDQWFDWKAFLSQFFRSIPHILSYHHFFIRANTITCQTLNGQPTVTYPHVKEGVNVRDIPNWPPNNFIDFPEKLSQSRRETIEKVVETYTDKSVEVMNDWKFYLNHH
jgi:hypothetical protein